MNKIVDVGLDLEMRKMEYLKFWDKLKKYEQKILGWFNVLGNGQTIFPRNGQIPYKPNDWTRGEQTIWNANNPQWIGFRRTWKSWANWPIS